MSLSYPVRYTGLWLLIKIDTGLRNDNDARNHRHRETRPNDAMQGGTMKNAGVEFSHRVRPAPDVLVRELDGEAVLLNLDNENYYGLDQVGARMWALVTTSESVQAAYEYLAKEYDVDADTLRRDLEALINKWLGQGLVTIDDA
ncbi:MAG: PqqD family protein [Gammaproteobacteria bacterium]|nr:PqqD family protein [Gammaproteobacteria bacterium]